MKLVEPKIKISFHFRINTQLTLFKFVFCLGNKIDLNQLNKTFVFLAMFKQVNQNMIKRKDLG